MTARWITIFFGPLPWQHDDLIAIGVVVATESQFATASSEAMALRATDLTVHLAHFMSRVDLLTRELARRTEGRLDLNALLAAIPDQGTTIVLSDIQSEETEDFDALVERLCSALPKGSAVGG